MDQIKKKKLYMLTMHNEHALVQVLCQNMIVMVFKSMKCRGLCKHNFYLINGLHAYIQRTKVERAW